jgi:hypothetical protein
MLTYFISDLHLDAWCPLTTNKGVLRKSFEELYGRYFIPAEAVSIAGDIADDDFTFVAFCEFIAEKYKQVYIIFGNHDLTVRGSFGDVDGFMNWKTTEDKLAWIEIALSAYPNVHLLDGNVVDGFGGTMGMCDFTYDRYEGRPYDTVGTWHNEWYDGRHWNYMGQDPIKIWESEKAKMDDLVKAAPKVMLTHFFPTQMGIQPQFVDTYKTAWYCFDGAKFLEQLPETTIWQAGHTHGCLDTNWVDKNGKGHRIICNTLGLPHEKFPFVSFKEAETFLIDVV